MLATLSATVPVPAMAARSTTAPTADDPEALYVEALQAKEAGQASTAAGLFDRAYRALPAAKQASETGQAWVVDEAHGLYVQAYADSRAVGLLEADQALLRDFLAAVRSAGDAPGVPATKPAEQALTSVEQLVSLHYQAKFDPVTPVSDPVATPGSTEPDRPPRQPDDQPAGRRPGVILVAVGATMATVGVAATVVGATRVPWARAILDDRADPADNDRFIASRELERNVLLGLGIPMTVVGAGLLAWGAVRMTARRSTARLRVTPGPTLTGLGVQVGF